MNARLAEIFSSRIDTQTDLEKLEFDRGQVWRIGYGDYEGVTLLIVKRERHETLGNAIHVCIRGPLHTRNGNELMGIPHLPFTPEALRASDLELVGHLSQISNDWVEMYEDWQSDARHGEAGLFSLTVTDILDSIFNRLSMF